MKKEMIILTMVACVVLSGCSEKPVDTDKDGIPDNNDAFPLDAAAHKDSDGDGHPDEWNEGYNHTGTNLTLDMFISDPTEWNDTDGDGIGDNSDEVPDDPRFHKLTYLIEQETRTFNQNEEKEYSIKITENYKQLVIYWILDTSNDDAVDSMSIRYKTPTIWSTKYKGTSGQITKNIAEWGIWTVRLAHDGHLIGYAEPITITYRAYVLE